MSQEDGIVSYPSLFHLSISLLCILFLSISVFLLLDKEHPSHLLFYSSKRGRSMDHSCLFSIEQDILCPEASSPLSSHSLLSSLRAKGAESSRRFLRPNSRMRLQIRDSHLSYLLLTSNLIIYSRSSSVSLITHIDIEDIE